MEKVKLSNELEIFHLNTDESQFLYHEIFEEQLYLKNGITLSNESCVFDVGANIGLFSVWVHQLYPNAIIHAFEPIPEIFEVLQANLKLYAVGGKAHNCGLAETSGTTRFIYYPNNSVMSGRFANSSEDQGTTRTFMENKNPAFAQAAARNPRFAKHTEAMIAQLFQEKTAECRLQTLSEVIQSERIEKIDLLKLDVEKSEKAILAGIQDQDWPKIRQIVAEIHDIDGRLNETVSLLRSKNYHCQIEQDPLFSRTNIYTIYAIQSSDH